MNSTTVIKVSFFSSLFFQAGMLSRSLCVFFLSKKLLSSGVLRRSRVRDSCTPSRPSLPFTDCKRNPQGNRKTCPNYWILKIGHYNDEQVKVFVKESRSLTFYRGPIFTKKNQRKIYVYTDKKRSSLM